VAEWWAEEPGACDSKLGDKWVESNRARAAAEEEAGRGERWVGDHREDKQEEEKRKKATATLLPEARAAGEFPFAAAHASPSLCWTWGWWLLAGCTERAADVWLL
jgi:hypothetical protein